MMMIKLEEENPQNESIIQENTSMVNSPRHYNHGKLEVIDVIEDWNLGFNLGNVLKYIARAEHKGNRQEDLQKAKWYLSREIERLGDKDA